MAKYKVVNQRVEINGKTREIDTVLDEKDFRPSEDSKSVGELESLLKTGHVVEA